MCYNKAMSNIDLSNFGAEDYFFAFFVVSFALLALIGLAALPGLYQGFRKQCRLLSARCRRGGRTLADPRALMALSPRIEGLYYFEDPAEPETPAELQGGAVDELDDAGDEGTVEVVEVVEVVEAAEVVAQPCARRSGTSSEGAGSPRSRRDKASYRAETTSRAADAA